MFSIFSQVNEIKKKIDKMSIEKKKKKKQQKSFLR